MFEEDDIVLVKVENKEENFYLEFKDGVYGGVLNFSYESFFLMWVFFGDKLVKFQEGEVVEVEKSFNVYL